MKLIIVKDYEEMSLKTFEIIENLILKKNDACISFTTGATPKRTIELLKNAINNGLNIENCKFLNLDEYYGPLGPYSVKTFMDDNLYNHIFKKPKLIEMFDANGKDEINRFKEVLKNNPRDFQMLGLGTNAHIGANEPGTSFDSTCFIADSWDETILATKNLYNLTLEQTPTKMYTMGFKEILEAKTVLLFASGKSKQEAVKKVVEGEINESIPASILKKHQDFVFIIDEEAATLLK